MNLALSETDDDDNFIGIINNCKKQTGLNMALQMIDGIAIVYKNNKFYYCNYEIEKFLGYNQQELIDSNYTIFIAPKDIKKFNFIINTIHEIPSYYVLRVVTKGNKNKKIKMKFVTNVINNDKYSIVIIRKNISIKQKNVQNNNLVSSNKNSEIMTNLFHELKTPINVLLSAVQVTKYMIGNENFKNKDKVQKYLNIMKQNCFRLIKLTNNIIDMTKIEAGYYKLNMHNYDIVKIVEDVTMSVADYVKSKGINIKFITDIHKKITACDPDKIEMVILNLISNAVKFTPKDGYIYIKISDKIDKIIISVKDTGLGIPKCKQKQIFEKYVQVDETLEKNKMGSGIGLYIVKNVINSHGGNIYLNDKYDKGCEFIIELPIRILKDDYLDKNNGTNFMGQENIEKINIQFSDIYNIFD